jgi:hypothetical protein
VTYSIRQEQLDLTSYAAVTESIIALQVPTKSESRPRFSQYLTDSRQSIHCGLSAARKLIRNFPDATLGAALRTLRALSKYNLRFRSMRERSAFYGHIVEDLHREAVNKVALILFPSVPNLKPATEVIQ